MSDDISVFFVHTVTVESRLGVGAAGDVYSAGVAVWGYLDGKVAMVRAVDGESVVSQSQFYCSIADGSKFALDSRITLPDGRKTQVIAVNKLDVAGLLPGVEHTVVYFE